MGKQEESEKLKYSLVYVLFCICPVLSITQVHFASSNFRKFLPYLPREMGLEDHFEGLLDRLKKERSWDVKVEDNLSAKKFDLRYFELYYMFDEGMFSDLEMALLNFIYEYDQQTDDDDFESVFSLCIVFRDHLQEKFNLKIERSEWIETCHKVIETPVEKLPRQYMNYIMCLLFTVFGVFMGISICIMRTITILERYDRPEYDRKMRKKDELKSRNRLRELAQHGGSSEEEEELEANQSKSKDPVTRKYPFLKKKEVIKENRSHERYDLCNMRYFQRNPSDFRSLSGFR